MPYKFKRNFSSLKTGLTYVAGSVVPTVISSSPAVVAELLRSGDIELERIPIPEPIEEPLEEPLEELPVEDAPALVAKKTRKTK